MLIDRNTTVIIQGITGKQGRKTAAEMVDYGTRVVAGVTPGRGGTSVDGIPVYESVTDACRDHPEANTSLIAVPRDQALSAAEAAITSGPIKLVNILTEGIPVSDAARIIEMARDHGVRVIGPASVGIIAPAHRVKIGAIGGNDPGVFYPGRIAIFSKSGGMCLSIALDIFNHLGFGVSLVVGVGGDRIIGATFKDFLEIVRDDPDTSLIILNGEVGGNYEEEAAEFLNTHPYPKRVIARLSGLGAEAVFATGSRMGHAGGIIGEGGAGSYESKVRALESAGVPVAASSEELITLVEKEMPRRGQDFERAIDSDQEIVGISKAKLEGLKAQVRAVQVKTSLTHLVNGVPYLRGFDLRDLIAGASIAEAVHIALTGEEPTPDSARAIEAEWLRTLGSAPVSQAALAAAEASYAAGNSLNAACATGLLAAGDPSGAENGSQQRVVGITCQTLAIAAHLLGHAEVPASANSPEASFFAALSGQEPTPRQLDVARAIFVACIDHTPATPSSLAAITAYSGGNSLKTALAAGIAAMGDSHAGAGEGMARLLQSHLEGALVADLARLAERIVEEETRPVGTEAGKIPGYGHRYYSLYGEDPRAVALLKIIEPKPFLWPHTQLALEIERILRREKSPGLCINVDGVIGALLSDMGIDWRAGKAAFIIPRTVGILVELTEQKAGSFFRLDNDSVIYTGPDPGRKFAPTRPPS